MVGLNDTRFFVVDLNGMNAPLVVDSRYDCWWKVMLETSIHKIIVSMQLCKNADASC